MIVVCTHLTSSARVLLAPMTVSRSLPSRAVLTVFIKCWRESALSIYYQHYSLEHVLTVSNLYAVFRCVCVGITDCCLLSLLSALMLQCCLSVPSLTVWWYGPLISVEVMWNRAVHIVSRLAKRSQLGSSLWLLAEVAWWREREREMKKLKLLL